ncbi:MAG: potassium transporter TrkA, partial [Catenulispora sp.]|nr:potassium transporter TrkA [Catenulispora sp.]
LIGSCTWPDCLDQREEERIAVAGFGYLEAAACRGETAIGYRIHTHFYLPPLYGVVLNAPKHTQLTLTQHDRVIVLAHD